MIMPILGLSFIWKFIAVVWVVVAVILMLVVLIQKGKGAGLGGAFGAGGSMNTLLGTKTGDFFTWVTIVLVAVFLILAILLGIMAANEKKTPAIPSAVEQQAPAATEQMPEAAQQAAPAVAEQKPLEQAVEQKQQDLNQIGTEIDKSYKEAEKAVKDLATETNLPAIQK